MKILVKSNQFKLYSSKAKVEYDLKRDRRDTYYINMMVSVSLWSILISFMTDGNGWRDLAEVAMVIYALSKGLNESEVSKCIYVRTL